MVARHQAGLIAVSHQVITSGSSWGRRGSPWLGDLTWFNSQLCNWLPALTGQANGDVCTILWVITLWCLQSSSQLEKHTSRCLYLMELWPPKDLPTLAHPGFVMSFLVSILGPSPPLAAWSGEFALKLHNKNNRILPQKAESHIWLVIEGAWREKLICKHLQFLYQGLGLGSQIETPKFSSSLKLSLYELPVLALGVEIWMMQCTSWP